MAQDAKSRQLSPVDIAVATILAWRDRWTDRQTDRQRERERERERKRVRDQLTVGEIHPAVRRTVNGSQCGTVLGRDWNTLIEWFGVFNVAGVELDKIIYKVRNCSFLYTLIKRFGAFKKFKVAGVECFVFSDFSAEARLVYHVGTCIHHTHKHTCIYTYMHAYIHTYIHTVHTIHSYIHTYIHA